MKTGPSTAMTAFAVAVFLGCCPEKDAANRIRVPAGGWAAACAETLSDGALELRFASADEGFGCAGIVNRLAGDVRFVTPRAEDVTLWEVHLRRTTADGSNETIRIDNRVPAKRSVRRNGNALAFSFRGIDLPDDPAALDVVAHVALVGGPGRSEWRLDVRTASKAWAPTESRYPYFSNIAAEGAADLLMPSLGMGARLVRNYDTKGRSQFFTYPGGYPMMGAYLVGSAGLYLGAHDPDQRIKGVCFRRNQNFSFTRYAENAGVVGKADASQRYPVVVQVFRGNWWQAAKIYRTWALGCPWTAKGPKAKRTDYPKRMADVDVTFIVEGEASGVSNYLAKVSRGGWAKLNRIADWTKWGNMPFDSGYPDLLPPRKGVKETSLWAEREKGVATMPYSNGRVWSLDSASFHYARKDAVKDERGGLYVETYTRRKFTPMCPAARAWQDILVTNTLSIVNATGAGAVYVDQISCSGPRFCYDGGHGHPLCGGTWWADGYRKALGRIHAELAPRNIPITSEEGGDAWDDVIDGHLLPSMAKPDEVPFYPAVYSDYTTYFGTPLGPIGMDFDAFFRSLARSTLWGVVPGWVEWPTRVKYAKYGEAMRRAGAFRADNRAFIAYGRLVGDVPSPEGTLAVRWRDVDGVREAIAFANVTSVARAVEAYGQIRTCAPYSFVLLSD